MDAAFVYRCLGIYGAFSGAFLILFTLFISWLVGFKLELPLMVLVYYGLIAGFGSASILKINEKASIIGALEPHDRDQIDILLTVYVFYPILATVFLLVINRIVSTSI